jgi:xylulokinase
VELLGAPDRLLPRIVETTDVVGEVTREAAAATGLRAGTPVAAGCGDTAAGVLGAGVVRPATALDVAGSAAVLAVCTDAFRPDVDERMLLTARAALPGLYYALGYVQGGGLNLGWFRDAFARELPTSTTTPPSRSSTPRPATCRPAPTAWPSRRTSAAA